GFCVDEPGPGRQRAPCGLEKESDQAIDQRESDQRAAGDSEQRADDPFSEILEALQDRNVAEEAVVADDPTRPLRKGHQSHRVRLPCPRPSPAPTTSSAVPGRPALLPCAARREPCECPGVHLSSSRSAPRSPASRSRSRKTRLSGQAS